MRDWGVCLLGKVLMVSCERWMGGRSQSREEKDKDKIDWYLDREITERLIEGQILAQPNPVGLYSPYSALTTVIKCSRLIDRQMSRITLDRHVAFTSWTLVRRNVRRRPISEDLDTRPRVALVESLISTWMVDGRMPVRRLAQRATRRGEKEDQNKNERRALL